MGMGCLWLILKIPIATLIWKFIYIFSPKYQHVIRFCTETCLSSGKNKHDFSDIQGPESFGKIPTSLNQPFTIGHLS